MENLESRRVLATFTVNVAYDAVDASPGDGKCDDDSGNCTLRAAIQEVNAQGGSHDIFVPSGTFTLAIAGRDEDAAATGDLDIAANATITGSGPGSTIIAADGIDRVFHVLAGAMATLNGLTVTEGSVFFTSAQYSGSGGGILNFGTATLTNSTISGNTASDVAGGVFNNSYLTITNSTVAGNSAGDRGGGIHNWGEFTLTGSTVSGNTAGVNGGGIANYWTATLTDSTLALNTADGGGGGIVNNGGRMTLASTILSQNNAGASGGAILNRSSSTLVIHGCTIGGTSDATGNTAYNGGGIYNIGEATIEGSVVSSNAARSSGGGIYNTTNARLQIANSVVGGNEAGRDSESLPLQNWLGAGGGIHNFGDLTLAGSEVSTNLARFQGGGITNFATTTLTDSALSGNTAGSYGGGMFNRGTTTISRSIVSDNLSKNNFAGGGVFNGEAGNVTVNESTVSNNSAEGVGGGVFNSRGCEFTLSGSTVSRNSSGSFAGGISNLGRLIATVSTVSDNLGGGIDTVEGTTTLADVKVIGNSGNGIRNGNGGTTAIASSVISGNSAIYGGGIYNGIGMVTVDTSSISGNRAANSGGGVYNIVGAVLLANSIISGNSADVSGGGMQNSGYSSTLHITNSTVSGNEAERGGGLYNRDGGTLILTGATVAANLAVGQGGGLFGSPLGGNSDGSLRLNSAVVAGNIALAADHDVSGFAAIDAAFSLIGDVGTASVNDLGSNLIGGGDNPVIDPMLGPLKDNGGPTETHALLSGSPAIDAGNAFGETLDQRGESRTVNIIGVNDPPPGDGSDIGAFEVQTGGGTGPCSSPSGMAVLQPNGVLQVEGTNQADDIEVREVNGLYRVRVNLPIFEASFDPNLIGSIRVLACDGNDEVYIRTNIDRPTVIEGGEGNDILRDGSGDGVVRGGPGNDQIYGNAGQDQLFGNAGADVIRAGSGRDFLDGGGGADTLFGNDGFDILLGGLGGDNVQGNAGRDVLIGGLGNDDIDGGGGMDLLIAGTTSYDANRPALDLVMEEWSQGGVSQQSYAQRVMHLRNGTGTILGGTGVKLDANNTVFDDGVADSLLEGGGALDWFFADLDGQDGDDDVIVDLQPGEEVDLLN